MCLLSQILKLKCVWSRSSNRIPLKKSTKERVKISCIIPGPEEIQSACFFLSIQSTVAKHHIGWLVLKEDERNKGHTMVPFG